MFARVFWRGHFCADIYSMQPPFEVEIVQVPRQQHWLAPLFRALLSVLMIVFTAVIGLIRLLGPLFRFIAPEKSQGPVLITSFSSEHFSIRLFDLPDEESGYYLARAETNPDSSVLHDKVVHPIIFHFENSEYLGLQQIDVFEGGFDSRLMIFTAAEGKLIQEIELGQVEELRAAVFENSLTGFSGSEEVIVRINKTER